VRVGIVGAGPAGLFLSILLRRAGHDVAVVERNPPDATYGWGVVFSEETLGELRDADDETYRELDAALVRWSAIDIRYRGEVIRSHGHGFSAIARTTLLRVLQDGARRLGARLEFEQEAPGPGQFSDRDVIVGADGVNSAVRRAHEAAFRPRVSEHASRFVWFGSDLAFEVFTFVFRLTEHGLFQVHAYPFDAARSTVIVECTDATWRAAGLDRMSEDESLAFCQDLFAQDLAGRRLLSNRSRWLRFTTLRCGSWHDGNVVLLGDAVHTAHFSIGSGTKLAMEDAIALASALRAHPGDLPAAFAEYEAERQGPVERFQQAATDSARYFESVGRYTDFAPEQFAFNLLTRSGRITHGSLALRDPAIVDRVDAWLTGCPDRVVTAPPRLAPLDLATTTIPNRVVLVPPSCDDATDGLLSPAQAAALAAAGAAGAGLVYTEPVAVTAHGRVTSGSPGLYDDAHIGAWEAAIAAVAAPVAVRLSHAGRRGATRPRGRGVDRALPDPWPLVAATAAAYTPRSPVPAALDEAGRAAVADSFAAAAGRAAAAGAAVCVVDWSDGYLLAGHASPLTHPGDLGERLAFPLMVLAAVRDAWPADRPLGVRLNADDRVAGGVTPEEAVTVAGLLSGVDLVDVTSGHTVPRGAPDYRRAYQTALADRVRNEAGIPVIASGRLTTLDDVDTLVAAGRADLCILDRTDPRTDRRPR
jgi:anthraniloyl-CoA monooxygenase